MAFEDEDEDEEEEEEEEEDQKRGIVVEVAVDGLCGTSNRG